MDDHDEGPGLMTSRVFWIGGAMSVLLWTVIAMLIAVVFA